MNRIRRIGAAALAVALLVLAMAISAATTPRVQAAEAGRVSDPDSDRARWFQELRVPEGARFAGEICCSIADGHPVEAEDRGGRWFALWEGAWVEIPPEIVLPTVSIDEKAYLFVYAGQLRCFVPPLNGF